LPILRLNDAASIAGSIVPCAKNPRSPPERAELGSSETSAATFANFSPPSMRFFAASTSARPLALAAESGVTGIWITWSRTSAGAFGNFSGCALK
jgi:hypothetical protein